jgi:Mn2+/Fe2+ NRAMP family transporter
MALEVFVPYTRYVNYLKWLTLVLFSYVVTVCLIRVPWLAALKATTIPRITWSTQYLTSFIAILGTTISPYLAFWQASEEAEEVHDRREEHPLKSHPAESPAQLRRIRIDTYVGMAISNLIAFFIILATATTLHQRGILTIDTAQQAAQALEPLAGYFAFLLFALGIIGTRLLAVPVLVGASACSKGRAKRRDFTALASRACCSDLC